VGGAHLVVRPRPGRRARLAAGLTWPPALTGPSARAAPASPRRRTG
jgi:hypothetical protein